MAALARSRWYSLACSSSSPVSGLRRFFLLVICGARCQCLAFNLIVLCIPQGHNAGIRRSTLQPSVPPVHRKDASLPGLLLTTPKDTLVGKVEEHQNT